MAEDDIHDSLVQWVERFYPRKYALVIYLSPFSSDSGTRIFGLFSAPSYQYLSPFSSDLTRCWMVKSRYAARLLSKPVSCWIQCTRWLPGSKPLIYVVETVKPKF
uniref:Uncharacterized protein n=1 Tax=Arundo donax TaxID=35708 RepID=A0A0A9DXQ5_ARUDO